MSTTEKKSASKGIRYTDAQKKEVTDFAVSYNAANGRGGQSKAAEKFKISQLTVAAWLKAAGSPSAAKKAPAAKAPAVAKAPAAAKAPKAAKASKAKKASKVGTRYTPAQKKEVVDFVASYNAANGRGGQSTAAAKFGVSPLTVMAWLKSSGAPKPTAKTKVAKKPAAAKKGKKAKAVKAPKPPKAGVATGGNLSSRLLSLVALSNQIDKAESDLAKLKARFSTLKASL